jgi:hypothetical protein
MSEESSLLEKKGWLVWQSTQKKRGEKISEGL